MYTMDDTDLQLTKAHSLLLDFLERQQDAGVLRSVQVAQVVSQFDPSEPTPHQLLDQALRDDSASEAICAVLTSPLTQMLLSALGVQLPLWRPFLLLLPAAAQALCQERQQRTNTAVGLGLMAAGVGLAIYAARKGGLGRAA